MNLEPNKNVVRAIFGALEDGRIDDAMSLIDPNAQWWVQGTGFQPIPVLHGIWSQVFGMPGKKAMTITSMTGEEDRVSAELESNIPLPDGRFYRNTFHILFTVREGKVAKAREYFDTAYTQAMFGAPPA